MVIPAFESCFVNDYSNNHTHVQVDYTYSVWLHVAGCQSRHSGSWNVVRPSLKTLASARIDQRNSSSDMATCTARRGSTQWMHSMSSLKWPMPTTSKSSCCSPLSWYTLFADCFCCFLSYLIDLLSHIILYLASFTNALSIVFCLFFFSFRDIVTTGDEGLFI